MAKVINFPTNQRVHVKPFVVDTPTKVVASDTDAVNASSIVAVETELRTIPIIEQALFFLDHAGTADGIRLTAKGSLGRNFVQAYWGKYIDRHEGLRFRPTREFDCPDVTRIYSLLADSKYVRKFKGVICLTPKGRRALEGGPTVDLYRDILNMGVFLELGLPRSLS